MVFSSKFQSPGLIRSRFDCQHEQWLNRVVLRSSWT